MDEISEVFLVEVRDVHSDWHSVESVHVSAEGAEKARKNSQSLWGEGTPLNPPRYIVRVTSKPLSA